MTITRFAIDANPGFVECELFDANGQRWVFVEKVPVLTLEDLDVNSVYPRPGFIACQLVERRIDGNGNEVMCIDTELPWHVETTCGRTDFEVRPEQLVDLD